MQFEWNSEKAEENRRKHSVSFEEARTVFDDPLAVTFDDPYHAAAESRSLTIGYSSRERLLVVSHAQRGETIRIISARLATAHERKRHET